MHEAFAWAEASERSDVGTRGLLVGIMHAGRGHSEPDDLLRHFDVRRERLFDELRDIVPGGLLDPYVHEPSRLEDLPPHLTANARKAIDEALGLVGDGARVELPHLFGGLLQIKDSTASRALERALGPDVSLDEIRKAYPAYLASGLPYAEFLRAPGRRAENVPTHPDRPSKRDDLGRDILAEVLATRLRKVREQWPELRAREWPKRSYRRLRRTLRGEPPEEPDGPRDCFILHLDGRWGSGKSSLLNLVEQQLQFPTPRAGQDSPPLRWVVVRFNAWEHQRIAPPWWWLMRAMYQEAVWGLWRIGRRRRAFMLVVLNLLWRLRDGWAAYILLPVAAFLVWLLLHTNFFGLHTATKKHHELDALVSLVKSLGALGGFAAAVWGGVRGINRWLLVGSAQGAATLIPRTRDPMKVLKRRHAQLIRAIGLPIVVFIDDLDRCKAEYVVELLEGIQTLFAEQPVTYIIAADRRWVSDSFGQVYRSYKNAANEPGRPLGYLFLEKTFQLVVPVPGLADAFRESYWKQLIQQGLLEGSADVLGRAVAAKVREEAERAYASLKSEDEVVQKLQAIPKDAFPIEVQEHLRAGLLRLEDSDLEEETSHTLEKFGGLLEDNPRAMKRLVNAYGIARHVEVMDATRNGSRLDEADLQRLALRTIVRLRWPILDAYIEEHPEALGYVQEDRNGVRTVVPDRTDVPSDVLELLAEKAVQDVLLGKDLDVSLQDNLEKKPQRDDSAPAQHEPAAVG